MKDFKTYLAESKKTYKFKIGVAGELPEHTAVSYTHLTLPTKA